MFFLPNIKSILLAGIRVRYKTKQKKTPQASGPFWQKRKDKKGKKRGGTLTKMQKEKVEDCQQATQKGTICSQRGDFPLVNATIPWRKVFLFC